MAFKVTAFFQSVSGVPAGWSESYLDTKAATQAAALNTWDSTMRPARLGILASQYSLRYLRAIDTTTVRASLVKAYTLTQGLGLVTIGTPDPSDWGGGPTAAESFPAMVALILRLEATAAFRRMFLLRGLPIGLFDASLTYQPSGVLAQAIGAFQAQLVQGATYGLSSQVKGPAQFPSAIAIGISGTSLQVDLPGAAAPAGWAVNATFRMTRTFAASSGVNGTWKISTVSPGVPDANHTRVFTFPKRRLLFGTPVGGVAYIITPTPVAFTAAIPIRGTKRNTGRPFGQLRGRAPARRS